MKQCVAVTVDESRGGSVDKVQDCSKIFAI